MAETPEAVMTGSDWQQIGPYRGQVFDAARYPQLAEALATLGTRLDEGPAELLQGGRHQTFRLDLVCGGETPAMSSSSLSAGSRTQRISWDAMPNSQAPRTLAPPRRFLTSGTM